MYFERFIPTYPLSNHVEFIQYHHGYNPSHDRERLLPDGQIEMIIPLEDDPLSVYDNQTLNPALPLKRGFLSGIRTKYITIDVGRNLGMVVTRFHPGGAHALFGIPMDEFGDLVIELEQLWGQPFLDLRQRMLEADRPSFILKALADFMLAKRQERLASNGIIHYSLDTIHTNPFEFKLRDLSREMGYSEKQIVRHFRRHVGTTPKQYARLIRFQRIIKRLDSPDPTPWAQIALESGYYDQSHFVNEFGAYTGVSPTTYMETRGEVLNYMPVA
ncbi:helix-turn-helix domain-containing protein [bacterium]|nr:helix-turn-helix domain-containing protein [bacterium]